MASLMVEVDDEVLDKLERVTSGQPARTSEFVSSAIHKALWELEEQQTANAYALQPDSADDVYVDPDAWRAVVEYEERLARGEIRW